MEPPENHLDIIGELLKLLMKRIQEDFFHEILIKLHFCIPKNYMVGSFDFLKNNATNELIVSFRGTRFYSMQNMCWNVKNLDQDPPHLNNKIPIRSMVQESDGRISAYAGHWAGGFYATHVNKEDQGIFRVTFNGFKIERGSKNWNLRTKKDLLTKYRIVGGIRDRCFTVCDGSHSLNDFSCAIDRLNWKWSKRQDILFPEMSL